VPPFRSMNVLWLCGVTLLGALGCKSGAKAHEDAQYGEPVGIQMEASGGLPAFEVALAVTRGVVVDPLVPPITTVIHQGLVACPRVVQTAATSGQVIQIAFSVRQGHLAKLSVSGVESDGCLAQMLDGRSIQLDDKVGAGRAHPELDVLAQVRFGAKAP